MDGHEDQLSVRPINVEEAFARQNDRIAYLRSVGLPWAEAVYELRDQLEGLEDEEFWDGVPPGIRDKMKELDTREQRLLRESYAHRGWLTHKVRAFPRTLPDGRVVPVFMPTNEDLSRALRIVRALATRNGITWRHKRVARLGYDRLPPQDPDPKE